MAVGGDWVPRARLLVPLACAAALGGCGGDQSALDPKSTPARDIATLWWWMLAAATVVFLGAVGLLGLAWLRRRREGVPVAGEREGLNLGMVVVFGMGIPAVVLIALFVIANFVVLPSTDAPAAGRTSMTIQVIGRQWFWDVRYPGTRVVTANEIHIPAGTRVNVIAQTADVIHSFWVPQLNRKIDMIPGRRNRVLLYAEKPGRYRGQCAEFCGLQHAHMAMYIYADPPQRFRAWLDGQRRAAASAAAGAAANGEQIFMRDQCASCHTIRGTTANGKVGPDLTHVASRSTLAALAIPNTRRALADWIRDPQHVKPGNRMPELGLSPPQVDDVVAYLESLR
jgi:cytochrome c oxidase subunit II